MYSFQAHTGQESQRLSKLAINWLAKKALLQVYLAAVACGEVVRAVTQELLVGNPRLAVLNLQLTSK